MSYIIVLPPLSSLSVLLLPPGFFLTFEERRKLIRILVSRGPILSYLVPYGPVPAAATGRIILLHGSEPRPPAGRRGFRGKIITEVRRDLGRTRERQQRRTGYTLHRGRYGDDNAPSCSVRPAYLAIARPSRCGDHSRRRERLNVDDIIDDYTTVTPWTIPTCASKRTIPAIPSLSSPLEPPSQVSVSRTPSHCLFAREPSRKCYYTLARPCARVLTPQMTACIRPPPSLTSREIVACGRPVRCTTR